MEQRPLDGAGVRQGKRRKNFQASIFFTKTPAPPTVHTHTPTHTPGVLQTKLWGGGKNDNFLFLETFLVLEAGWKNPVKTQ